MSLSDDLEVSPTASAEEIKAAYCRLAQDYHPDRNQGATVAVRRMAEERLKRINGAYETLKDPARRQRYDATQAAPRSESRRSSPSGPGSRSQQEAPNGRGAGDSSADGGKVRWFSPRDPCSLKWGSGRYTRIKETSETQG